jgi:MoaA/NifB/PqqE/SkfB family radical SAM enzyme
MDESVLEASLSFIRELEVSGTQDELALTGMGEAIIHPEFCSIVPKIRKVISGRITLSTNGVAFTEEIASACASGGVEVYISAHRPEKAAFAVKIAREYGVLKDINGGALVSSFDWAGQIDWFVSAPKVLCDYLKKGWCVILANGDITTCCIDAHGKGKIGNVFEHRPVDVVMEPWSLCDGCHMTPPS